MTDPGSSPPYGEKPSGGSVGVVRGVLPGSVMA